MLSIDTSTRGCSVALHQQGQLISNYHLLTDKSSSAMLTTLIQNVVSEAGFSLAQLEGIAVAKGPGSYTGLRIGVSTAKGLCYALDKPLVAVNTLQAMTLQVKVFFDKDFLFCPMLDARRMEVYCAIFDNDLEYVAPTQATILEKTTFASWLDRGPVVFFGDGAAKAQPIFAHSPNARFIPTLIAPSAATVGQLAYELYRQQQFEEVATFEPFYLKDFVGTVSKKLKIL